MKKPDARKRYTRQMIKEAFFTLLKKKPVNRITVKELCELAQLNRATFYAHYKDCFDLMESIEAELLTAFETALQYVDPLDAEALITTLYDVADENREACQTLIFGNADAIILQQLIQRAKASSINHWKEIMPQSSDADLEMLYTHLSNGLLHVVVEEYGKYDRADVIRFVTKIVKITLSLFCSYSKSDEIS